VRDDVNVAPACADVLEFAREDVCANGDRRDRRKAWHDAVEPARFKALANAAKIRRAATDHAELVEPRETVDQDDNRSRRVIGFRRAGRARRRKRRRVWGGRVERVTDERLTAALRAPPEK
jgi:hypothetical protein